MIRTHLLIVTVIEVCVLTVVVDVQPYVRSFREEDCRVNFILIVLIRFKLELWYKNGKIFDFFFSCMFV